MDAWICNLFHSFFTEFWAFTQSNIQEFPEEMPLALTMRVAWGAGEGKHTLHTSWGYAVSSSVGARGGQRMCSETSVNSLTMELFIVNQASGTSRGKIYA